LPALTTDTNKLGKDRHTIQNRIQFLQYISSKQARKRKSIKVARNIRPCRNRKIKPKNLTFPSRLQSWANFLP